MTFRSKTYFSLVAFLFLSISTISLSAQNKDLSSFKSSKVITTIENGKTTTLTYENGKLKSVEIDGEQIDESEFEKYNKETPNKRRDNVPRFFGEDMNDLEIDSIMRFSRGYNSDSIFNSIKEGMNIFSDPDNGISMWFGGKKMNFDSILGGLNFNMMLDSLDGLTRNFRFSMPNMDGFQNFSLDMDNDDFPPRPRRRGQFEKNESEVDSDKMVESLRNNDRKTLTSILSDKLNKDGLLKINETNKVELTSKFLKINGEKMPEVIFEKYKKLYEGETGLSLLSGNNVRFEVKGESEKSRKLRAF
jgi:hypothetical protein